MVWEWADRHRELTDGAEKGRWRTDRTPWLRMPMEVMSVTHPAEEIVLQCGAQIGKTATVLNFIGYAIDHEPDELMLVLGTIDAANRYVRTRIDPLIESTEALRDKVSQAGRRDGNTRMLKRFVGGHLRVAGANSAKALREASVRYLVLEEVSGYEDDAGNEGDPVLLAIVRTRTYEGRRKVFLVSTPNRAGTCRIDLARQAADQEWHFHVPCPSCGTFQQLEWPRFVYDVPPRAADGSRPRIRDVRYACRACDAQIPESAKGQMVTAGKWVCVRDNGSTKSIAFWLPAFVSTLGFTWTEAATMYEAAKGDANQMRAFVNTVQALPYAEPREAPPWEPLFARRETYRIGVVQPGARFLTAGVDVQADRLEFEVVGWGRGLRSWSVTKRVLPGDPTQPDVWRELDEVLATEWPCAGGGTLPIWCLAIDSGFASSAVYRWARANAQPAFAGGTLAVRHARTVMVTKGTDRWGGPLALAQKVDAAERKRGLKVVLVAASGLKQELYRWLRLEAPAPGQPEPHGFLHFPEYDDGWFKQLTAEHLEIRTVGGRPREVWVIPEGVRNEALDCRILARAAAAAVGVDRFSERQWAKLEATLPEGLVALPQPAEAPAPAASPAPDAAAASPTVPVSPAMRARVVPPTTPQKRTAPTRRFTSSWLRR